jgi:hypothetical protein
MGWGLIEGGSDGKQTAGKRSRGSIRVRTLPQQDAVLSLDAPLLQP